MIEHPDDLLTPDQVAHTCLSFSADNRLCVAGLCYWIECISV